MDYFESWLQLVKLEIETPGKWQILSKASEFRGQPAGAEISNALAGREDGQRASPAGVFCHQGDQRSVWGERG